MRSINRSREHKGFSPMVEVRATLFFTIYGDTFPVPATVIGGSFSEYTSVLKASITSFCSLSLVSETLSVNNIFYCIHVRYGKKRLTRVNESGFLGPEIHLAYPVLYHAANSVENYLLSSEILCDTKFTSQKTKTFSNQKETTVFSGCSGSCCIMTAAKILTLYSSNYLQIHSYWKKISALR